MKKIEAEKLLKQNNLFQQPELVEKLICPVCNHKVLIKNNEIRCADEDCGSIFPIQRGVPILINEADSIFNIKDYADVPERKVENNTKKFIPSIRSLVPSLSNNISDKNSLKVLANLLSKKVNPKILIVGGGIITTNLDDIKWLFKPGNIVIESDVYIGPRTQIVLDDHHIPFENNTFDLVVYQAVLEHVADPTLCVQEAHRILKSDGIVFAETPFMQQVHMKQYDFTRFTYLGHRRLFRSFDEIEAGVFAGTGVALGWSIKYFVGSLFDNKYARFILQTAASFMFFWLKYVDYIIRNHKGTYDGASGFYFIGSKSNTILSDKELIKLFKGY